MTAPFVFSNLPVELVRDILEHAAHSDRATARSLTLVSSAVKQWTDPILYDTVVLSTARSLRSFIAAIANKPSEFVRTRVRNLGIFTLGPVQSIDRVLAACAGVQRAELNWVDPREAVWCAKKACDGWVTQPSEFFIESKFSRERADTL